MDYDSLYSQSFRILQERGTDCKSLFPRCEDIYRVRGVTALSPAAPVLLEALFSILLTSRPTLPNLANLSNCTVLPV